MGFVQITTFEGTGEEGGVGVGGLYRLEKKLDMEEPVNYEGDFNCLDIDGEIDGRESFYSHQFLQMKKEMKTKRFPS